MSYGLVIKALDSQSKSPRFKTTEWLSKVWLSRSFFPEVNQISNDILERRGKKWIVYS